MKRIEEVYDFLLSCGFPKGRAEKMAQATVKGFRIERENVLNRLKLKSVDGWLIVCSDNQPGKVTFGALKSQIEN
jgi:hypothetical protein